MTAQLSRERLEEIAAIYGKTPSLHEAQMMAQAILAGMDSEPVGEVVLGDYDDCGDYPDAKVVCIAAQGQADWNNFRNGTKLYAAPPAPVAVPDEISTADAMRIMNGRVITMSVHTAYKNGWNACRAAMLKAGPVTPEYSRLTMTKEQAIKLSRAFYDSRKDESNYDFVSSDSTDTKPVTAATEPEKCWCRTCRPVDITDMRFVVCPDCGNKRCPKANDHRNACSGSNEPGQVGSAYPAAPVVGGFRENAETSTKRSREHFISLCNQFWNWQEFDEINAGDEEPRLEWNGKEFTHRVTQALWRMYQAAPEQEV